MRASLLYCTYRLTCADTLTITDTHRKVDAAQAAADAGAVRAVAAAARVRLAAQEIKELAAAALITLVSHPAVLDVACSHGVLPLMIEMLQARPSATLAVAALQCACMLMYGRGDMMRLAAEGELLQTLQDLRAQEYGDDFEALSINANAMLQLCQ